MAPSKICYKCDSAKDIEQFQYKKGGKILNRTFCIECERAYHREYYRNNKNKFDKQVKQRRLQREYKISIEEFEALKESQNYLCAICGKSLGEKQQTHIDHCHKTGIVRGVLCNQCNRGLGYFNDDIEKMSKALEYLKRFENGR